MALALLAAGVILSATLFQSVLGYGRRVEARLRAAQLARHTLVSVRDWLRDAGNFDNPAAFSLETPEVDGFRIDVSLSPLSLRSPNSSLDRYYTETRKMDSSYLRIEILVSKEGMEFPMVSIAGAPRRTLAATPVVVEKVGGATLDMSMAPNASQNLQARLLDSSGREIPDVFFQWSVRPIDGVATLTSVTRDGRAAALNNVSKKRDGTTVYTGGSCQVGAGTVYGGQDLWSFSNPISLGVP